MIDVVIVDDEIWVTKLIERIIDWNAYGFRIVKVYNDGFEALEGIKVLKPELVLTDIRMPGITGLDIIQEISAESKDIFFAIISGYSDFEYAKSALTYGAVGYLLKPIDQQELIKILFKVKDMISAEDTKKQDILNLRKTFDNTIDKLREQYFSRIFEGGADDDISIEKINQDLNLNFQEGTFLVLNLIYGQVENEPEVNEKVLKVMWECGLPSVCIGIVALTINYKIVIILNYKTEVSKLVLKHVNEFFDNIFDKRISNEIVLSIGTEEQSIKGLRNSYYNANIIAFGRLNQGVNRIYNSRDYAQLDKDIPIDPEIDIRLKQAFNSNSRAAVISIINKRVMELTIMNSRNPIAVYVGINHILKLLYENTRNTSKDSDEWMEYFEAKKAKIQAATSKGAILSIFSAIVEDIINYKTHDELNRNEILIGDAKKYIDNNYMSDISLDDVSKIVQLNPNYFCEIFRKETGYNFKEYLSLRRVEAAKELLKNVSYKITDISNLVGYNDARHFSKMFKKYVGITPSEYRRLIVGYE